MSADDLLDSLAGVARMFKNETAELAGHSTTAGVDYDELTAKVGDACSRLDECLQIIVEQRDAAGRAAAEAKNFYETLASLMQSDAETLRARRGEYDGIDDAHGLRRRAAVREEELDDMAQVRELAQTAKVCAEKFSRVEAAIAESRDACVVAKERAANAEEELQEVASREEEQRRKEEEDKQKHKAEEMRRRQQQQQQQQKEKEAAERRRREQQQQQKQQQEEEEKAAAAEDDRQWPTTIFPAAGGEFDSNYGCAVRAPPGELHADQFCCRLLPMDEVGMAGIPATEEVVGNVVHFESAGLTELPAALRGGQRHWVILVPHCAQRMSSRETVVYKLKGSTWVECPSAESHVENAEHQARWVETRISEPSATVVAVNKLKTDRFCVGKAGIRFASSVDNRVSVTIPEDAVKIRLEQTLEVQPIDSATMASMRATQPRDTAGLLTTSSIIIHTSIKKYALRPVTFAFPLPLNPSATKKSRPGTAAESRGRPSESAAALRPKTAKAPTLRADEEEDERILLVGSSGDRGSGWAILDDVEVEEEAGKDSVSFRTSSICNRRFVALRVGLDFNNEAAPRLCETVEKNLEEKTACFVLRQKSENLSEVMVMLTASNRLDRALKQMQESGYDYEEPSNSERMEMKLRERQKFAIRFRGNIVAADDDPEEPSDIRLVFNSQMKSSVHLVVTEKDRFAQRALEQYRGFLDCFTDVVRSGGKDAKKGGGVGQAPTVVEEKRVASLLVTIPKADEDLRVKSPRVTPFSFKAKDSVTMEYLRELAELIGDNWEQLADKLEITRKRCSVIKRNFDSQEQQAYDMLLTWVKMQHVSKKKAPMLFRALNASGFGHLAEGLRDREQQQRQSARSRRSEPDDEDLRRSF